MNCDLRSRELTATRTLAVVNCKLRLRELKPAPFGAGFVIINQSSSIIRFF